MGKLTLPLAEIKSTTNLFNSQTPFGVGFGLFPFKNTRFLGVGLMSNFGRQSRVRPEVLENLVFPLAQYPDQKLVVNGQIPEALIEPYKKKVTSISLSLGLIIRL